MYSFWDKIKAPLEEIKKHNNNNNINNSGGILKQSMGISFHNHQYSTSYPDTSSPSSALPSISLPTILKQSITHEIPNIKPSPSNIISPLNISTGGGTRDTSSHMAQLYQQHMNLSQHLINQQSIAASNMGVSMGIPSSIVNSPINVITSNSPSGAMLPVANISTPALANVVAVPAQVSEITPMTPISAIPTISSPPIFINSQATAQPSPRLNLPTLASSMSISPSTLISPPMVGSNQSSHNNNSSLFHHYPITSPIQMSSSTFPSPSFRTMHEIPRSQFDLDNYQQQHDDDDNPQQVIEMREINGSGNYNYNNNNTIMINIPTQGAAQQFLLDGADFNQPEQVVEQPRILLKKKKNGKNNKEKMKKFKKSVYEILAPTQQLPIHLVDHDQVENYVVPFLMELGRALLMSGVPAHRLEYELTLVSSTFGIDGNFFSTPTGIFFSFGSPHTILSPYTHLLRIQSTDYNMDRVIQLENLADEVIYGRINCQEALARLHDILKAPPLYNMYLMVFSFVVSSFAIAFFFKAGWVEIGACSLIGLYVGLLYAAAGRWPTIGRVLEALSALGGAVIATFFNAFIYPVHIFLVVLGGIIALAPGLSLTIAVAEISTRNLVSGNARLMGAFSCLLQLTFGIALGTRLASQAVHARPEVSPDSFPEWTMFLAIPLAAISFAVQMKVHPRQIWIIMLTSILGVLGGNWGNKIFGEDVGSFFGACLICIVSNLYARFTNGTSIVPIMSGIILLVPGSMGVKGLFTMSSGNVQAGIALFGGMFMISTSLAIGLLVANLLVPPHKAL